MKNLNAMLKKRKAELAARAAGTPPAATGALAEKAATAAEGCPAAKTKPEVSVPMKKKRIRNKNFGSPANEPASANTPARVEGGGTSETLDAEDADPAAQAVREIKLAIDKEGGAIKVCPSDWHTKYKATLGGYKKFLMKRCDGFLVTDTEDKNFIVTLSGNIPSSKLVDGMRVRNWRRALHGAWKTYCGVTPAAEQNLDVFFGGLREDLAKKGSRASVTSTTDAGSVPQKQTVLSTSPGSAPKVLKKVKKKKLKKKISVAGTAAG